jgi:hypothetical protein
MKKFNNHDLIVDHVSKILKIQSFLIYCYLLKTIFTETKTETTK